MKMNLIQSVDNPQIKNLKKLVSSARERRKQQRTIVDGVHLLTALSATDLELSMLVIRNADPLPEEIKQCLELFPNTQVISVTAAIFKQLSPVETPTGILGVMELPKTQTIHGDSGVLLENVQDPGNLGSILRTSAAAGINCIYLSKGCAEAWSPKALRAGMGAHFQLTIVENADLVATANQFDKIIATQLNAPQSLFDINLTGSVGFLFGNEGAGLSDNLLSCATDSVAIPMPGEIESLNVGAAVAVCLFERVRQLQVQV